MKLGQPGEIYFIREHDASGGFTPFVKVGLVGAERDGDSFDRLKEHQTGNPRRLFLDRNHIIETHAVGSVETLLHGLFARQRISGEWFEFTRDDDLVSAIEKAREVAAETKAYIPFFEEAERLKSVPSDGTTKPASEEDKASHRLLTIAKTQLSICGTLKGQLTAKLAVAYEAGVNISDAGKTQTVTYASKFLEESFKSKHPKIYEKYLVEGEEWQHRFTPQRLELDDSDLGDEFLESASRIEALIASYTTRDEILVLNEASLDHNRLKAFADWTQMFAEARIKVALGSAEKIEGVCTWKRYYKPTVRFDEKRFAGERSALYRSFMSVPESRTRVQAKRTRAATPSARSKPVKRASSKKAKAATTSRKRKAGRK